MKKEEVWQGVLADLEVSLSRVNFSTWIKPIKLKEVRAVGGRLVAEIGVPSGFYQQMLERRYQGQIQAALERLLGQETEVVFKVTGEELGGGDNSPLFATAQNPPNGQRDRKKRGFLNPRLTFENFVVGSSNNLAHAAAQGIVQNPGRKYNPLFIYGGVGLGKTHLMHAIGHALLDKYPEFTILYISAEKFVNDLIDSLKSKKTTTFKKKYRSCDVLLVDDIQFISGKETTQEEFFHTFNELYMSERQIILTSDRPPDEIPRIEERLSSRFMGGLTVDIQPPDFEMRVGILQQKAKEMGVVVEQRSLEMIAEKVTSNVRELEGVFRKIVAMAETRGGRVERELVREFLGKKEEGRIRKIRPSSVIAKTAKYYGLSSSDLKGKSRKAPVVAARHAAMYLLKTELGIPYMRIGDLFGGRDHTTVMHGVEKIEEMRKTSPQIRQNLEEIKDLILA